MKPNSSRRRWRAAIPTHSGWRWSICSGSDAATRLRALDAAGLLTQIIPALEPARTTDQPNVHFLPVLAHSPKRWRRRLAAAPDRSWPAGRRPAGRHRAKPSLAYHSRYTVQLRAHFAEPIGRYPRAALFKLGALLHDVAKPQTKQLTPDGGVSFHEHQTIGGEIAAALTRQLGFADDEVRYVRTIVREHMRPGQLAVLDTITMRAVLRFFSATGTAGPDVLLHLLADHMATWAAHARTRWIAQAEWIDALLDVIWGAQSEPVVPLANGDDLILAFGLRPGPLIGRLLAAIGAAGRWHDHHARAGAGAGAAAARSGLAPQRNASTPASIFRHLRLYGLPHPPAHTLGVFSILRGTARATRLPRGGPCDRRTAPAPGSTARPASWRAPAPSPARPAEYPCRSGDVPGCRSHPAPADHPRSGGGTV
ncbi:MAG: HDIG domain-containing protein [Kouleothrix sp.]